MPGCNPLKNFIFILYEVYGCSIKITFMHALKALLKFFYKYFHKFVNPLSQFNFYRKKFF